MAITMKGKYLNAYEAAFDTLSKTPGYVKSTWEESAKSGDLGAYTDLLLHSAEIKDFDKVKKRVGWDYTSGTNQQLAMYNELYADRTEKKKRKDPKYNADGTIMLDAAGNKVYDEYEATDYEYNWKQLEEQKAYYAEQYKLQVEQANKEDMSWFRRALAGIGSGVGRYAEGVAQGFARLIAIMEGAGEFVTDVIGGVIVEPMLGNVDTSDKSLWSYYKDVFKNASENFVKTESASKAWEFFPLEDIAQDLYEFERKYTNFRNIDGKEDDGFWGWYGRIQTGIANMYGNMAVAWFMGAGVGAWAGSLSYAASGGLRNFTYVLPQRTISSLSQAASKFTFYASITGGDIKESYDRLVLDPNSEYTKSTSWILVNSVFKSAAQYGVEKILVAILGGTTLDNLVYGTKVRSELSSSLSKAGAKRIVKDAFQEGLEEVLQDTSDAFINQIFTAALEENFGGFKDISLQSLMDSFVVAAIGSIGGNAVKIVSKLVEQIKGETPTQITYDKDGNMIARKLNALEAWEYGLDMQSFIENYNYIKDQAEIIYRTSGKDSIEAKAYRTAFQEMYASLRLISSIYTAYGPDRVDATNKTLEEITNYIHSDVFVRPDEMAEKMYRTIETWESNSRKDFSKYVKNLKEKLEKAFIKDVEKVIDRDTVDQLDLDGKTAKALQEAFSGDEKLQRVYITNTGDRTVTLEYDDGIRSMFVPISIARNGDGHLIYANVAEQQLVETIAQVEGFKIKLNNIKLKYNEITGQNIDTDEVVYQLLYNKEFFVAVLWTIGKDVLDIADKLYDLESTIISKDLRTEEYKKVINKSFSNIRTAITEYCIYNENAQIPAWLSKNSKAYKDIKMKRYVLNIRNKLISDGFNKLTNVEQTLLEKRINLMTIAKSQKEVLLANIKSDNVNLRTNAMNTISKVYASMFKGLYDGTTYLQWGTKGNNIFNYFLQSHNLTLQSYLNESLLSPEERQYIISNYGDVTSETILQYRQDIFKQSTNEQYRFGIENGNLVIYESKSSDILSFNFYRNDEYADVVDNKTIVIEKTGTSKADKDVLKSMLSNSLDDASKASLSINDVVTNPNDFLSTSVKDAIRNDYGVVDEDSTFLYMRRQFIDKLEDTTIVKLADGSYKFATTSNMNDIYLLDKGLQIYSKNPSIKNIVKDKYLVGRLADIKIKYTSDKNIIAQYNPSSNTILVNNKLDRKLLNFAFAHEFQHAIQYENQMTTGLCDGWLYSLSKVNKALSKEIVADIRKHNPQLFVIDGKEVDDKIAFNIANDYVYYASGEYQAYGMENKIDFIPVTIHDADYGTTLTMPWGKQYKLTNGLPMSFTYKDSVFNLKMSRDDKIRYQNVANGIYTLLSDIDKITNDINQYNTTVKNTLSAEQQSAEQSRLYTGYNAALKKMYDNKNVKLIFDYKSELFNKNTLIALLSTIESVDYCDTFAQGFIQFNDQYKYYNGGEDRTFDSRRDDILQLIMDRRDELDNINKITPVLYADPSDTLTKSVLLTNLKARDYERDIMLPNPNTSKTLFVEDVEKLYYDYNTTPYMNSIAKSVFAKVKELENANGNFVNIELSNYRLRSNETGAFNDIKLEVTYNSEALSTKNRQVIGDTFLHELGHLCTVYMIYGHGWYESVKDSKLEYITNAKEMYDPLDNDNIIPANTAISTKFLTDMFEKDDGKMYKVISLFKQCHAYLLENYYLQISRKYGLDANQKLYYDKFIMNREFNKEAWATADTKDIYKHAKPYNIGLNFGYGQSNAISYYFGMMEYGAALGYNESGDSMFIDLKDIKPDDNIKTLCQVLSGKEYDNMFDISRFLYKSIIDGLTPEYFENAIYFRLAAGATTTLSNLVDEQGQFIVDGLGNKNHTAPSNYETSLGAGDTNTYDRSNSFAAKKTGDNKLVAGAIDRFEDAKRYVAGKISTDSTDEYGIFVNSRSGYFSGTFKGGNKELAVADIVNNIEEDKNQDILLHTHPGRSVAHLSLDDIFANYDEAIDKGLQYVGVVTANGDIELMDITALSSDQKAALKKIYKSQLKGTTNYTDNSLDRLYGVKYSKSLIEKANNDLQKNVVKGLKQIGVRSEATVKSIVDKVYDYTNKLKANPTYETLEQDITNIIKDELYSKIVGQKTLGNKYRIAASYITENTYFNQPEFNSNLDTFAKEELANNLKLVGSSYGEVFVDYQSLIRKRNKEAIISTRNKIEKSRKEKIDIRKQEYVKSMNIKSFNPLVGKRYVSRERAKGTNLEYFFKDSGYNRVQMSPKLQYFVVNATDSLPDELWSKIKDGSLKESDVYDYFRDNDNIDDKTFKLINDSFFQNKYITNAKELSKLVANTDIYYAARIVLSQLKFDEKILNETNSSIYDKVIKIINNDPTLLKEFNKYILNYNKVYDSATKTLLQLDVSDKYLKMSWMRYYDGTPYTGGYIANIARVLTANVALSGWLVTGEQTTRKHIDLDKSVGKEGDLQVSELIADANALNDFDTVFYNSSRERKSSVVLAIYREKFEKLYENDKDGVSKLNTKMYSLEEELDAMSDSKFEEVYKVATSKVKENKLKAMQMIAATLDIAGKTVSDLSANVLDKLYKRGEEVAKNVRPDSAVRTNIKHLATTIRKNLSENDRKRFYKDNSDIFTEDLKVKDDLLVAPKINAGSTKEERAKASTFSQDIKNLENRVRELSQRVRRGEYASKAAMDIKQYYDKLLAKRDRELKKQLKNATKLLTVQVADQTIEIKTDKAIPKALMRILESEFTINRESNVKYLDYENKTYAAANFKKFVEQNAEFIQQFTQQDIDEIVDFLSTSQILANSNAERKAMAAQVYLMVLLLKGNRIGNFVLSEEQYTMLNERLQNTVSVGQQVGGIWRSVMKELKPEETIVNSLAIKAEVEFNQTDVQNLIRAVNSKDIEQMKLAAQRLYSNAKVLRNRTKLDALLEFERMAMLSSPGTWIRNIVSNVAITGLNAASEQTSKLLTKLFPQSKLLKHRENQYTIVGTKVSTDTMNFIKTNIVDNGLLALIDEGLSKQHTDSDNFGKTSDLIVDAIRLKVRNDILGANISTNKTLSQVYQFIYARLSDSKFVNKAFVKYLGKTLTEDNVDLTRGLTREVQEHIADAYTMAAHDFMHKGNFWGEVEKTLRDKIGPKGFFVYKQVFPFAQSSFNWFMEGMKYNPVGLALAIKNLIKLDNTIDKLDQDRRDGKRVVSSKFAEYLAKRDLGKGVIGSIGFIIGAILVGCGAVKLKDDDDKVAIQIGSVNIDMSDVFGTQGIVLGMSTLHALKDKDIWTALRLTFDQMFKDSTINNIANNLRYGVGNYIESIPFNMANMYYPNFIATLSKVVRTYKPVYNGGLLGKFERFFSDNIPGVSYLMPKYVDPYTGKKQYAYSSPLLTIAVNSINRLTPLNIEAFNYSKYEKEAINLGISKTMPTGSYTVNKTNIKLSMAERVAVSEFYGKLNERDLKRLMDTNAVYNVEDKNGKIVSLPYKRMSDEQKKSVVNRIMTNNGTYAKIFALTENDKCTYYGTQEELNTLRSLGIRKNLKLQNGNKKGLVIN